jgi:hypothetical protein
MEAEHSSESQVINCKMTGCNVHKTDLNRKVLDKIQSHVIIVIIIIIIIIIIIDIQEMI